MSGVEIESSKFNPQNQIRLAEGKAKIDQLSRLSAATHRFEVWLEAKGIELWPLIRVVLARVAEAVLKPASLLGQGPNEAFACGDDLRLGPEHGILESQ